MNDKEQNRRYGHGSKYLYVGEICPLRKLNVHLRENSHNEAGWFLILGNKGFRLCNEIFPLNAYGEYLLRLADHEIK